MFSYYQCFCASGPSGPSGPLGVALRQRWSVGVTFHTPLPVEQELLFRGYKKNWRELHCYWFLVVSLCRASTNRSKTNGSCLFIFSASFSVDLPRRSKLQKSTYYISPAKETALTFTSALQRCLCAHFSLSLLRLKLSIHFLQKCNSLRSVLSSPPTSEAASPTPLRGRLGSPRTRAANGPVTTCATPPPPIPSAS